MGGSNFGSNIRDSSINIGYAIKCIPLDGLVDVTFYPFRCSRGQEIKIFDGGLGPS